MVIPAVALKILGGAVAIGAVVSSIAVPTALSMNTAKEIVLKDFPRVEKDKFKDKCQLLTKDEDSGKRELDMRYLLVCDKVNDSGVEFYYFSSREVPKKVISLEKNGNLGSSLTKVKVKTEESGGMAFDLTSTKGVWTNLIGKKLENCNITKDVGEKKKWSVRCPREGTGDGKEIPLTPIIIN
ncbi:hypothetical protein WEN_02300 [Mycoplasma wenyonii str. Massachusetts]|uniref:Uncharacterized protein n=1 Tax=Mycoplasma wenyonii (strain Massachusetts) TaxID=1197325 RepID=I6ZF81_MYCWM|nr:hypothetical protein [Mycoplasma wenyonii]AFN65247.1 hypothetical protein WEN_02300 [Mycoplasma wenyonii str. Massachusetts]